jgi:hypothetical protein
MSAINPASCVNPAGNMQVQPPSAVGPGAIMRSNANSSLAVGPGFGHRAAQYGKLISSLPIPRTCSLPFSGRGQRAQHAPPVAHANFDEGYNAFSYQLPGYNAQTNFNMTPWAGQGSRYNQQAYNAFPMQGARSLLPTRYSRIWCCCDRRGLPRWPNRRSVLHSRCRTSLWSVQFEPVLQGIERLRCAERHWHWHHWWLCQRKHGHRRRVVQLWLRSYPRVWHAEHVFRQISSFLSPKNVTNASTVSQTPTASFIGFTSTVSLVATCKIQFCTWFFRCGSSTTGLHPSDTGSPAG